MAPIGTETPQDDRSQPSKTAPIVIPPQAIERVLEPRKAQGKGPRPAGHPMLEELTTSTATDIADRDSTLYESVTGDLSNGTDPNVFVGKTLGVDIRRAVLHFDLAGSIPAGSTVTAATLTLHVSNSNSAAQTIALRA